MSTDHGRSHTTPEPEAWLHGPLPGIIPALMPAAHALLQAGRDIERNAAWLSPEEVWHCPGGAPSIGFHLQHVAGSIDRLLTYARGAQLDDRQLRALAAESSHGDNTETAEVLIGAAMVAIEEAVRVLRATPEITLFEPRAVGRGRLPSTVFGLLFHLAEHTQRHAGQVTTTAHVVRGPIHGSTVV